MADIQGEVCITGFFNLDFNASISSSGNLVYIVPVVLNSWAYINRIKGYNPSGGNETIAVGYIDSQNAQIPFNSQTVATVTGFNTQLDMYIAPQFGAYWSASAASYPATVQLMVDGYYFNLC